MEGTVKWFNKDKGYGFITDERRSDIFVHYAILMTSWIWNGRAGRFDVLHSERGPQRRM
ncbi:MAG: cold shock domain-containing protein [Merdibacter sp.]